VEAEFIMIFHNKLFFLYIKGRLYLIIFKYIVQPLSG